MEWNDCLEAWKQAPGPAPREEAIRETIRRSREAYAQQEPSMRYGEFLWTQLRFTRKRWWALQAALLWLARLGISGMDQPGYRLRSLGVIGCLFVVLIIPELWRNRESDSTQVEAACLYSLRQIYAARVTLFGLADLLLLTPFCLGLGRLGLTWVEVMSQFLLPAVVTACICFCLLCGRQRQSFSVSLCLSWCAVWWLALMDEGLYAAIAPGVWGLLFAIALGCLVLAVRGAICTTNQDWEVSFA